MLNKWVLHEKRISSGFHFEVFDITEKASVNKDITDYLSQNLINNFVPLDVLEIRFKNRTEKELENYITNELFAPNGNQLEKNVRQGDWGEALTALVAVEIKELTLPAFKLRYKTNRKKSLMGLDVLAVESDDKDNFKKVILFESKTKITYDKQIGAEAYNSLRKDSDSACIDMINFLSARFYEHGDYVTAQKFDDLASMPDSINKEYHAIIIMEKKLWREDILDELNNQTDFDFEDTYINVFLISDLKKLISDVYSNTFEVAKRIVYGK